MALFLCKIKTRAKSPALHPSEHILQALEAILRSRFLRVLLLFTIPFAFSPCLRDRIQNDRWRTRQPPHHPIRHPNSTQELKYNQNAKTKNT